jgi:hypothetical protein
LLRLFSSLRWAFIGALASLLLVPRSQHRASWEQLRDGLRRKENFFANLFGTAPQALLAIARVSLGAQAVP